MGYELKKKSLLGTDSNNINVTRIMYQTLKWILKYFMRKESIQSQKLKSSLLIPAIKKIRNYLMMHRLSILVSKLKLMVIFLTYS